MNNETSPSPVLTIEQLATLTPNGVKEVTAIFAKKILLCRDEIRLLTTRDGVETNAQNSDPMPNTSSRKTEPILGVSPIGDHLNHQTEEAELKCSASLVYGEIIPLSAPTDEGWPVWVRDEAGAGWLFLAEPPRVVLRPHRVPYWLN